MFTLTEWKKTRFYQDVKEEVQQETERKTKLKMIPLLLRLGLTSEQIAQELELTIDLINEAIKNQNIVS